MAIGVFGNALHAGELPDPSIEAASALSRPLYWMFEMGQAALNPYRALADAGRLYYRNPVNPLAHTQLGKSAAAWCELFERATRRYGKPDWGIDSVTVRRDAGSGAGERGVGAPVLPAAAFRAGVRARAAPAAAQTADRGADVRPLCDAAARHGAHHAGEPRRLCHRLGRRQDGAARGRAVRSRRLYRLRHQHAASPRRRRACDGGVPAGGAGARRRGAHGGGGRSACPGLDGADGRADRHPREPDHGERRRHRPRARLVPPQRHHHPCRSRIPA